MKWPGNKPLVVCRLQDIVWIRFLNCLARNEYIQIHHMEFPPLPTFKKIFWWWLIYSLASSGVQACVQIASFCVITRLRQELSALSRDKLDCLIPGLAEFTTNLIQTCEKFLCILSLYVWHICLDVWMREWLWKQYCTQNLAEVKMDWSIGFTRSWIRIVDNFRPFYFVKFLYYYP